MPRCLDIFLGVLRFPYNLYCFVF
uniref:Uncharacterized protein n=1 Tax=Rhizophora mucronata TaxID=61149 RepID=A0A2P2PQ64_RHIMU